LTSGTSPYINRLVKLTEAAEIIEDSAFDDDKKSLGIVFLMKSLWEMLS